MSGAERDGDVLAGRYVVASRIGEGGMGAVYRATDTRLSREVAIKVLSREALGNEGALQRLLREARLCAALQHPGIVHLYDVGETNDGGAFLVMELVVGSSLRTLMADDSWGDRARLAAVVEVARALGAAHRAGLIHRDIKPDNVMRGEDGRAVLLDFGIAKETRTETTHLTGSGVVIGTPSYLSPEQAAGKPLEARTDQFSLAVTAFELLTRHVPWQGTTTYQVAAAIMHEPPPPLVLADVPLGLSVRPVLERAMAKSVGDRYADIDAFGDALAEAAGIIPAPSARGTGGKGGASFLPASLAPTAAFESSGGALSQTVTGPEVVIKPRRRRRWVAPLGATAGALLAAFGFYESRGNPLDVASPVVACPVLDATVDGKEAPWLGAAAAYALASDLAPMLGGATDHLRVPAELLGRPAYAEDAHELDPWSPPHVREETMNAARESGFAWIDGHIEVHGVEVSLVVVVHAPSGRELGRATASGLPLANVALRAARELRRSGALGRAHALDPSFASWEGISSRDEADAIGDLEAIVMDDSTRCSSPRPVGLPASWRGVLDAACAHRPLDPSAPAGALAYVVSRDPDVPRVELRERIRHEIESARPGKLKAVAMSMNLLVANSHDDGLGPGLLAVVATDPRVGFGFSLTPSTAITDTLVSNALTWAPDNSDWWLSGVQALPPSDAARAVEYLHREFILYPFGGTPGLYADAALRQGSAKELGLVVAYMQGSDAPGQRGLGRLFAARSDVLGGAFARTLAHWEAEMTKPGTVLGDESLENPRATAARELAYAMGKERELGDAVARAVSTKSVAVRIGDTNPTLRPNVAATCALASPDLGEACLAVLTDTMPDALREDWSHLRDVVHDYLARDYTGAAEAARGLVGSRFYVYYSVRIGDFLVDVFDRGGAPQLAEAIDARHTADHSLHGASLASVRAVRRAWARGDHAHAQALAKRVVEAWTLVDTEMPAVAEMNAILSH